MYSLDKDEYRKTFEKWIQRMQLCVDKQGDYFDHLIKENLLDLRMYF